MSFERSPVLQSLENDPSPDVSLEDLRISAEGDEDLEVLFEEVREGTHRYFDSVLRHERVAQLQVNRLDVEEYRELHQRLDHDRRITHNALCDKLRILARAEKKTGRDVSWWSKVAGQRENRNAIRRWALRTVFAELYNNEDK